MRALTLLLLVAVVGLSTVSDGPREPFRLSTLDFSSGGDVVIDRPVVPLLIYEGFVRGVGFVNVWSYFRAGWMG